MARIPLALQLYSIRDDCARDLPGCLAAVAKMGYDGVEFAGYCGFSAQDIRKMLDDNGLKCCGTHLGIDTLLGDELKKTSELNKVIGNDFLIVPGLPGEYTASADAWRNTAAVFNQIADRLAPLGQWTGYHNHHTEFTPFPDCGEEPWHLFFGNTKKEVVMQFDTGNAMHGGADPVPYFERYPGRALTVHLKEFSATNDTALIGEGDCPWSRLFELCETIGATQWYIVEQESYPFPPMECAERCIKNLKGMGK